MFSKSFFRNVEDLVSGRTRVRVAVLGHKGCGKTVFLTALANHLLHHDAAAFPLRGWRVARTHLAASDEVGLATFPYQDARDALSKGEWPRKTRDTSVLTADFALHSEDGRHQRKFRLEVLDLPGERVADFAMVGRSYREWCEAVARRYDGSAHNSRHFRRYAEAVRAMAGAPDGRLVASAYKDFLAGEYADLSLSLSPSTVKLGTDGVSRGGAPEDFRRQLEGFDVGLPGRPFAPLPPEAFARESPFRDLVKEFEAGYGFYVKTVVAPLARWLRGVDKLVYLCDVVGLLQRGVDVYKSERAFAQEAMRLFARGDEPDSRVLRFSERFLRAFLENHISAAYVVAPKADLVCSDENRSRLKGLAERMLGAFLEDLGPDVERRCLSVASVDTAKEFAAERALEARVRNANGEIERLQYQVSDVPADWPRSDDWKAGDARFNYPPTFPCFDARDEIPPGQLGLNLLLQKLLDV